MANEKNSGDSTPQPQPQVDLSQFGAVIGEAVARGIASRERKRVTIGEYNARGGNSPFHPDPTKRVKMTRDYYQNGRKIEHATAFDREIELLNQITHSGRYIDRLVEVVVNQNGSEETVDIRFGEKRDQAFVLKGKARDFTDMLEQIIAAQTEERAEFEDDKAARTERRRQFGSGAATRAAEAKAGK